MSHSGGARASIAAAWLLASALAMPLSAQTKRALVIGIDKYEQPESQLAVWRKDVEPAVATWRRQLAGAPAMADAGTNAEREKVFELDGSVNDAESIAALLRGRFHFDDVRLLTNTRATRAGMLGAIRQLIHDSRRGDVVVFYYAGHGSQRVNSLADIKLNHLDQTIVPVDANAGQFDIRNTELAGLFDELVDKGASLTLIFDSCHSGSITRGETVPTKKRWAAADPRDARDPVRPTPPEEKPGNPALLLAAAAAYETAQEETDATGKSHGAFTSALLAAIQQSPTPNEPAVRVFERTRAMLQQHDRDQHPTMRGTAGNPARPLFGSVSGPLADRITLTVQRVQDDTVRLHGGLALGFGVGTELRLADSSKGRGAVRLRVTDVSALASSRAVSIQGPLTGVAAGTQFVIEKWVEPARPALRVWIPASLAQGALAPTVSALAALTRSATTEWVTDPTTVPDDGRRMYVLRHDAGGWRLHAPNGASVPIASPTAATVEKTLAEQEALAARHAADEAAATRQQAPTASGRPRLLVILPPTPQLRARLELGAGTPNEAIAVQSEPQRADFLLVGRDSGGAVAYAWIEPNARQIVEDRRSLPVRTDWFASDSLLGDSLTTAALRLARVSGWLTLSPPVDARPFPYRFALRNVKTLEMKDSGTTHDGEQYELVLRRDPRLLAKDIPARWVYLFAIDSWGKGTPLWSADDRIPYDSAGEKSAPVEIVLRHDHPIQITKPYGTDTFIMIASAEQLDPEVFRFSGVRTRGADVRGRGTALGQVFSRVTGVTRGTGDVIPADWSIQRLPLKSVAPEAVIGARASTPDVRIRSIQQRR